MHLLFICTYNQLRSPTAEQIFKNRPGLTVRSAGTASTAPRRVSARDLNWADLILVMEKKHQEHLAALFPDAVKTKKVINLNIPDEYEYMDPVLVELLEREVGRYIAA